MRANLYVKSALLAALVAAVRGTARAQTKDADATAIKAVLSSYENALNASDTNAVMLLYAEDGVFMPPYSQSAVGADAVRQGYVSVFKTISLQVKFHVAEVVLMSPEWGFARTNSSGTNTVNSTGAKSAEANQELFIFKKGPDSTWRIARYSFSSTNPPSKE
jgi:uncharacterized protein (TIGR02246 family)